jgi:tetratricopeptide (TPR) repeat protein
VAKSIKLSDAFAQAVEQALEHLSDAAWLGKNSPLAAPYFLGAALDNWADAASPTPRGQALRTALQTAAASLPTDQQDLLTITFFKRDPNLNNTGVALRLGKAETTYYRHRAAAIEALAEALNQTISPPLHLAVPAALPLVGRESLLAECQGHLQAGHSVALTGRSGIGKTSLGLSIAHAWGAQRVFWFTVRPGLNDDLSSLAFALAYFLRGQDGSRAANAWRQLMADRGDIAPDRVLGLLRHDLAALPQPALLCIDDSDQLRPETRAHSQAIHLIEELSKSAPTLLLSQQALIESEVQVALKGLSQAECAEVLKQRNINDLSASEMQTLHTITRGLPLLMKLFADLRQTGESTAELLRYLDGERSAEALFGRIWKKLGSDERNLLMALSVLRGPTPASLWANAGESLHRLQARELVLPGPQDTLSIASQVQAFVLPHIPADVRPLMHARAAELRESLGEYTAAAFHWVQAGQPAQAIWLWWNHRELERGRGHLPAARDLFREIKQSDLPNEDDRRALALLRAEQALHTGSADEAEAELNAFRWPGSHPLTPPARAVLGDALQMQGRPEQAIAHYELALEALTDGRGRRIGQLHTKLGYIHIARLRNLARARHEALLALHQAHNFYGSVEEEAGNFAQAQMQYEAAMRASENLINPKQREHVQATTHSNLGHLFMRMGQPAQAIQHLLRAMQNAREVGETVNALYDQFNLVAVYTAAGQPERALAEAREGLVLAEAIHHAFLIAGIATNAAEACLKLGQLDEAEQFVQRALREEEERHRPNALVAWGQIAQRRGDLPQAVRVLREAVSEAQAIEDKLCEVAALRAMAEALRQQGVTHEAEGADARAAQLEGEMEANVP